MGRSSSEKWVWKPSQKHQRSTQILTNITTDSSGSTATDDAIKMQQLTEVGDTVKPSESCGGQPWTPHLWARHLASLWEGLPTLHAPMGVPQGWQVTCQGPHAEPSRARIEFWLPNSQPLLLPVLPLFWSESISTQYIQTLRQCFWGTLDWLVTLQGGY